MGTHMQEAWDIQAGIVNVWLAASPSTTATQVQPQGSSIQAVRIHA